MVCQQLNKQAEKLSVEVINDIMVCQEDSSELVIHNSVLVDVSYTKEVRYCVLVCGKHISFKNPSLGGDFHHKVGRSVVTYGLGSGTGSGCKYWEISTGSSARGSTQPISATHAQNSGLPVG